MNDRYLYRAKRKNWRELPKEKWWVEGYYAYMKPYHYIMPKDNFDSWIEIDEKTLCACTVLKDKNGKLIWENDILSIAKSVDVISGNYFYPTIPYPANVKVKWDFCAWMWATIAKKKQYIGFPDAWCHYEAEVIGNIFDNPELLEV